MLHHRCMHVENELVESVTAGEQEYEDEVPEPSLTDLANNLPAQGKPQCINLILNNHWIYIYVMCIYVTRFILKLHA